MTVVFYNSGPKGFINHYHTGPYSVGLSGSFPNGSLWSGDIDASKGATFDISPSGNIFGEWAGYDSAWFGGIGLVEYIIKIKAPSVGIYGIISLTSDSILRES